MHISFRTARHGALDANSLRHEELYQRQCDGPLPDLREDIPLQLGETEIAYQHRLDVVRTDCFHRILASLQRPAGISDAYWHAAMTQTNAVAPGGREPYTE